MKTHIEFGKIGEEMAINFLIKNQYSIIQKNWRSGNLEIDIIAKHENLLIFIEVKTRKNKYFGNPEINVSLTKQKKLIKAANIFIETFQHNGEIRFDIISIILNKNEEEIFHIKDAFFDYQK